MSSDRLRDHVRQLLAWRAAHATFDDAVEGIPPALRGRAPDGLPYTPWQLLEHLRRTQRDLLDFCTAPSYAERTWPDDYWPPTAAPPSDDAWDGSVAAYRADRAALQALAADPAVDLMDAVPNGDGQTYLRELLLAADHAAYHVGELVVVRRLLGIWQPRA